MFCRKLLNSLFNESPPRRPLRLQHHDCFQYFFCFNILFKSISNKKRISHPTFNPGFHKYDNEMTKEVKNAEKVNKNEKKTLLTCVNI